METENVRPCATVWEFRSVDGKQRVRVARRSYVGDAKYQHEYQRVIYRGTDPAKIAAAANG